MIFCSCNTEKEKQLLEKRIAHIKHGIMNNPFIVDIRVFYLQANPGHCPVPIKPCPKIVFQI
jgi:hypothetical protein